MRTDLYALCFIISAGFLAVLLFMIRGRKLREQYALLWLALGIAMMGLSLFPRLIDKLAHLAGVHYAPSLLYLLGLAFVLFILLHLTIAVSSLTRQVIALTQTLALMERHRPMEAGNAAGRWSAGPFGTPGAAMTEARRETETPR